MDRTPPPTPRQPWVIWVDRNFDFLRSLYPNLPVSEVIKRGKDHYKKQPPTVKKEMEDIQTLEKRAMEEWRKGRSRRSEEGAGEQRQGQDRANQNQQGGNLGAPAPPGNEKPVFYTFTLDQIRAEIKRQEEEERDREED